MSGKQCVYDDRDLCRKAPGCAWTGISSTSVGTCSSGAFSFLIAPSRGEQAGIMNSPAGIRQPPRPAYQPTCHR